MSLYWNNSALNNVMWNGVKTTGVWNGDIVWGGSSPSFYTLTLQTDGHGTLTANSLTGYPGDTVTLIPTYDTYYRFNDYSNTGGSIVGDVFTFGDGNATAQANFRVNAFTASGGWEKGSNVFVTVPAGVRNNVTSSVNKFAITSYHTPNVPDEWYETSSRWKVTSPVSAYSITLDPVMKVKLQTDGHGRGASAFFSTNIGNSYTHTASFNVTGNNVTKTATYSETMTTGTTGVNYSISSRMIAIYNNGYRGTATYLSNETTGTWVATGIAP